MLTPRLRSRPGTAVYVRSGEANASWPPIGMFKPPHHLPSPETRRFAPQLHQEFAVPAPDLAQLNRARSRIADPAR